MRQRIDPPSSLNRLDAGKLRQKIRDERLFVATAEGQLIGCVFARLHRDYVYLGKLAVRSEYRGQGVSRRLIDRVQTYAVGLALPVEIETRIELTENQSLFEYLGYEKIAENSHEGYNRPTSYRYRKYPV